MKKQFFITFIFSLLLIFGVSAQIPSYVPTDGLVGWWPFNGNAHDESGNGNDGLVDGAVLTEDRYGNNKLAYYFNGGGNEILIKHKPELNILPATISVWFKSSNNKDYLFLVNKYGCGSGNGYSCHLNKGKPSAYYYNVKNGGVSGAIDVDDEILNLAIVTDGNWHNYTISVDSSELRQYIDGEFLKATFWTGIWSETTTGQDLHFGRYAEEGLCVNFNLDYFFEGSLDDIGIWNRALTPLEVENLYNASLSCSLDSILNPEINYGSVSDADGNIYPTVKIGDQEWMAANLRTIRYQNGDELDNVSMVLLKDLKSGAWIYFDENPEFNCPHGKLYNWYAASDPRNVCPAGWHVPDDSDWFELFDTLGGVGPAATQLKSVYGGFRPNGGTNESGFSAFASGFVWSGTGWQQGHLVYLSSTATEDEFTKRIIINEGIESGKIWKNWGHTIRCVKDRPGQCNLIEKVDPAIVNTSLGSEVSFNAEYNTNDAVFQWQANTAAAGWADIAASDTYKDVNTPRLTINNILLSNHMQQLRLVANDGTCSDTSNVAMINIIDTCIVTVYDTIFTTISDTILTTVIDTLLIDVVLSNTADPTSNLIRVYPNPTLSHLVIDAGTYTLMSGYTLTITNGNGATIWTESISQPVYTLDMSGWTGKGLYYLTLKDPQGDIVTTRKIILQ
jgi:uncharacterized protein (TIGR02145 family)